MKGSIRIDQELCKGCSLCVEFCPKGSIVISKRLNLKGYFLAEFDDSKGCQGCAVCAVMCPEVAIEVYRG
jgi:2-oxoglutarate ferredoxin oxidoreductase subunit delta